jgi:single-strand DNA-binding protein
MTHTDVRKMEIQMAGSYNKVMLMGNLTRDIEIRHTSGNSVVGNFGIAVNRKYKTQSGEQREEVNFIDCTAFGRTAEVMAQYLGKGRAVFVEGRLKFDQWDDKNSGAKRSKLSVIVENFQFVDSAQGGGNSAGGGGGYARSGAGSDSGQGGGYGGGNQGASQGGGGAPIDHDDIPF